MSYFNSTTEYYDIGTSTNEPVSVKKSGTLDIMWILHNTIASVGIIANITVVTAFVNDRKLRRKIPNIFIINQVSL